MDSQRSNPMIDLRENGQTCRRSELVQSGISERGINQDCKVYVGDLGSSTVKQDLETSFSKYGVLKNVWVARNPPGFAFVEFEDARDALDSVKAMDGQRLNGRTIRVEMSNGKSRKDGPPPRSRYDRDRHDRDRYDRDRYDRNDRYDRDRSRERYRRRSPDYGPRRSRSPKRRSKSHSRSRSRSPYRSSRHDSHDRSPKRSPKRSPRYDRDRSSSPR